MGARLRRGRSTYRLPGILVGALKAPRSASAHPWLFLFPSRHRTLAPASRIPLCRSSSWWRARLTSPCPAPQLVGIRRLCNLDRKASNLVWGSFGARSQLFKKSEYAWERVTAYVHPCNESCITIFILCMTLMTEPLDAQFPHQYS